MRRLPLLALTSVFLTLSCGDKDEGGDDMGGDGDVTSGTTTPGVTGPTGGSSADDGASTGGTGGTGGGVCGNNMVDGTEQCDGTDLSGATCESLGEGMGTLGCDPMLCTYDTSMCMGGGGSTSSGG